MDHRNYIVDQNSFRLAGPPTWWLRQLWDFDPSLVVVPSRQGFYYRLAQRRPLRLPEHIINDILFKESDTKMLASHGLIPVTTILATANWNNPLMFVELASRAPHRQGGAAKVMTTIESQERSEEERRAVEMDDYQTRLSRDAWKIYRKKTGLGRSWFTPDIAPKYS